MATDSKIVASHELPEVSHQNPILEAINRILNQSLTCETEEQLGSFCLSVAEDLTQSKFGFIGEIGPDGNFHDIAVSNSGWKQCSMFQRGDRRSPGDFDLQSLIGRFLQGRKSLFTNDLSSHPDNVGFPGQNSFLKSSWDPVHP